MSTPPAVLVIGEALVDEIHLGDGVERRPGGSPTNVAIGLRRLGHAVSELTGVGSDENGVLLRAHLAADGVALHPQSPVPAESSRAVVRLSARGDAAYDFHVDWDVPASVDYGAARIVHAGSIALALEPGAAHVLALLRGVPEGVRVTVDPNVRAAFLPQAGAAERLEPFFRAADLVKLSAEDAAYLYPGESADALLDRLLTLGPSLVALTDGGAGATLATVSARVTVPAAATAVVDTIGAGDSFMAALVSIVSRADDWKPDATRLVAFGSYAAAAAGITVSRRGADLPAAAELADPLGR